MVRLTLLTLFISMSLFFFASKAEEELNYNFPRNLQHFHIETSVLEGNSTFLQYYFTNVHIGSNKEKQTLIVDTGSSIVAVPCQNYCK